VGIYDPVKDSIYKKLAIEDMAVCTSGGYVNYYTEDKKLHHIVDPATLASPNDMVSVTVTASTACRADLLSTALFVAGPRGKEFLRDGEKAYYITKDGKEIVV
jgi:thiamine biosynthesis lipoprotein